MKFYLTKTTTNKDEYLVHKEMCVYLPVESLRIDLGEHYSCESAISEACIKKENVNGCFHCALLCHTNSKENN